uniref:DDE_Tnp_IS1595 domain-containing protein n=1 Tax=Strongyloides papillosus TaxID=174720 RepID=A0A0N5BSR9_STREA
MILFQRYELVRDEEMSIKFLQERELLLKTKECTNGHEMKLVMGSTPRGSGYEPQHYCRLEQLSQGGGEGQTLEIDEMLFVRRKNHCGRLIEQQWCFEFQNINGGVEKRVNEDALIMSDMWRGYSQVGASGYEHLTVNQKFNFVDSDTNAHIQNTERIWKSTKERNKR